MWAGIMRDRFGATDARAMMLRMHVQTGGSTLQAQQPLVNVARVTIQALAAVLGGTQSLHTNGYDEALALPTEAAATLALRTQQVVGFESGVAAVRRPARGLGRRRGADGRSSRPTRRGSSPRSTRSAGPSRPSRRASTRTASAASAYAAQLAIECGEQVIVGTNRFTTDERFEMETMKVPDSIRATQSERLAALRAEPRRRRVDLGDGRRRGGGAGHGQPHAAPASAAVEARATVGEIAHRLRVVWGEYAG